MASDRPALPLPRRPAGASRVVSAGSATGPSTSTPVHTHASRSSAAAFQQSFSQDGLPDTSQNGTRRSIGSARRRGSDSPLILELDQHSNSSIALSPRNAPRRRHRKRTSTLSHSRDLDAQDATTSGQSENASARSGRRVLSTPLHQQRSRHQGAAGNARETPSFASTSTTSASALLGINGSILRHGSSSPSNIEESRANGDMLDDEPAATDDEDADYLSDASSQEASWELVDRMRIWRNDALNQHLYTTAVFWGSKVFTKTRNPNDGFWLAQAYFVAGMYSRAERVLVGGWQVDAEEQDEVEMRRKEKGKQRDLADVHEESMNLDDQALQEDAQTEELRSSATEKFPRAHETAPRTAPATSAPSQASTLKANARTSHLPLGQTSTGRLADDPPRQKQQIRLTEISVACRYLAAQAMVRQEKWTAAMDLLGEVNPFRDLRNKNRAGAGPSRQAGDGGIKFEASMCHLRGVVQLHLNAADRAKDCFMEALSIDVKCYESFEALVSGNMMDVQEEWNFIQGLSYKLHTPEDAEFIRMMYTIRLKKYAHKEEMERCGRALMDEYGLSEDPDVLFGLADELYSAMRYADCYQVTTRILDMHDSHAAAFPLHLACMHHLPHLRSKLFLVAHELVDREPDSVISWYAVGLWYFSGKRWEEARRYFGKGLLLDNRFGPAWIAFAHAFALEGEHDQAITAYSTAQRHFQGSHLPVMFIGMQYILLHNIKAASEYLDASYAMCQTDPLLLNELGIVAYYNERYEDAIQLFSRALHQAESAQSSLGPWATTHLNMGQAFRKLGDHEKAITSFKKTLELSPRNPVALSSMGASYLVTGETEEAILVLHDALAVQPGEPMTTSLLRLAMTEAMEAQTRGTTSLSHSMRFPLLSDVAAEDMDAKVAEDEMEHYGRILRIDRAEALPREGGMAEETPSNQMAGVRRKGAGGRTTRRGGAHAGSNNATASRATPAGAPSARQQASSAIRRGRSAAQLSPTQELQTHGHEGHAASSGGALDESQEMSFGQSSPVAHYPGHGYGYGATTAAAAGTGAGAGGAALSASTSNGGRRMTTRASTNGALQHHHEHGDGEVESQGENYEADETEASLAGSDMVD